MSDIIKMKGSYCTIASNSDLFFGLILASQKEWLHYATLICCRRGNADLPRVLVQ